jgi:DNA-binding transcriptional MerR regulator
LAGTYNRWARKHGYPERSKSAIGSAIGRRKLSRRAEGDWVTSSYIAEVLGVSIDVPQRWAERRLIESYKNTGSKTRRYFRRSDLVGFAIRHPELLGGIDSQRLYMLLENQDLADSIAERFPRRRGSGTMVQAVESGRIYQSVSEAGREVFATGQAIHSAIRTGGMCAGYHWKRIEPHGLSTISQAA